MMKKKARILTSILLLAGLLVALSGCARRAVKVPNVYVTYETRETLAGPSVNYGPRLVKRVEMYEDHIILYYADNRGEIVPLDNKLKSFRWSDTPN